MSGWNTRKIDYVPDSGQEVRKDGTIFDLTEWREAQVLDRNGQTHLRTYDPTNNAIFQDLLEEIKALHTTIKQIHNIEV
jgi:hypothetical protein